MPPRPLKISVTTALLITILQQQHRKQNPFLSKIIKCGTKYGSLFLGHEWKVTVWVLKRVY